jgi:hypothetical protein
LHGMHLTLDSFVGSTVPSPMPDDVESDYSDSEDDSVTPNNLDSAILTGCRHRLLDARRDSMDALRRGFVRCEDLSVQLGAFEIPELLAMLQGQNHLTADELLSCFQLPSSSEEEAMRAGFDAVGSRVASDFEALLRDGDVLGASARLKLLRWCTALTVLTFGGLRDNKIRLRLYGVEVDNETLPETHTCTREVRARAPTPSLIQ